MLISTQAIVINYTRYSDSSIIAHLFTSKLGRISVMVYGIKGKKKNKIAAFQPLYLLDIELDYKPNRNIQVLKEHHINPPLINLSGDVIKSAISLFLAEIIHKCLKEEASDYQVFSFLNTSIKVLDEINEGMGLFHLSFLMKLSRYLGFSINSGDAIYNYFDIKQMTGKTQKPVHSFYVSGEMFNKLLNLYSMGYNELNQLKYTVNERNELLEVIIKIYELHAINFNTLKSLEILKTVFN